MRIAIVGTDLASVDARGGGLEQVLRRWAVFLADAGHDVVIVSHGAPDPADNPGVTTVGITSPADLRHVEADVFSLHNRPHWSSRCPPGAPVAVTFHNYPVAWKTRRRTFPGLRASAVSHALAAAAEDALSVPVAVVPPPIDGAFLSGGPWEPTPTVLSPNRLMRKKGVLELLDVARQPAFADVHFSFADLISPWHRPTAEHKQLRGAIADVPNASLFEPPASRRELVDRYLAAGVVVCAALEPEGLGLVPLEGQALGVPVVTTDMGGLREATFPPNQCVPPAGLADALMAALRSPPSERGTARREVLARHAPAASGAAFARWLVG